MHSVLVFKDSQVFCRVTHLVMITFASILQLSKFPVSFRYFATSDKVFQSKQTPRKFNISRNKNKENSVAAGCTDIAHLFPRSD